MYEQEGFEGAKYVLTPPLRDSWHQAELWNGLRRNDLQVVSTDHCAFRFSDQKTMGIDDFSKIPNGGPGIENRLSLLYTKGVASGLLDMNRLVELFSTSAAKLFGLFPRKGTLAVGSDADIVVFDPDEESVISALTHHMNVDYNLYEGMRVKGVPQVVVANGQIVVEGGEYVGAAGDGRFLKRSSM
jgi:dihydropyrimidinase